MVNVSKVAGSETLHEIDTAVIGKFYANIERYSSLQKSRILALSHLANSAYRLPKNLDVIEDAECDETMSTSSEVYKEKFRWLVAIKLGQLVR